MPVLLEPGTATIGQQPDVQAERSQAGQKLRNGLARAALYGVFAIGGAGAAVLEKSAAETSDGALGFVGAYNTDRQGREQQLPPVNRTGAEIAALAGHAVASHIMERVAAGKR